MDEFDRAMLVLSSALGWTIAAKAESSVIFGIVAGMAWFNFGLRVLVALLEQAA